MTYQLLPGPIRRKGCSVALHNSRLIYFALSLTIISLDLLPPAVVHSAPSVGGAGLVVGVWVGDGDAQLLVVLPHGGVQLPLPGLWVLEPALVLIILVGVIPPISENKVVNALVRENERTKRRKQV